MTKGTFSVDASILEELGERLIGRAPIALAELIKNSYDADAATCRIEFGDGKIVISDDGAGISRSEFLSYWMRLGTTHKVDEEISEGGRTLTGSKGIGRLSVQFLAAKMTLESTSEQDAGQSLHAIVDWEQVVPGKDLQTFEFDWEMCSSSPVYPNSQRIGTRITLTDLKSAWDAEALTSLGREVWRLRSPFKRSATSNATRRPDDFQIELDAPHIENAWEAFDSARAVLFQNWKARIRGTLDQGRVGGKATISIEFKEDYPEGARAARRYQESVALPVRPHPELGKPLVDQAKFEILVFRTEGRQPGGIPVGELREYLTAFGNVAVYDAGFRLPYYGSSPDASGQDWLSIALDSGRRLNVSELLPERLRTQNKYMQDLPAPGRIFGAVEIDTNHERTAAQRAKARPGEWLQIQSARDRLHDGAPFGQLRDLVRFSLDLYANRYRLRSLEAIERERSSEPASQKYERVASVLERAKDDLPAAVYREIRKEVTDAHKASELAESVLDRRAALLAPLATAGMAALALSHELARETRFLSTIGARLRELAKVHSVPELSVIADQFDAGRQRLDSLRDIFSPLASETDNQATDRLRVRAVVDQTVGAMRFLLPNVTFDSHAIPSDLRFPVGALTEWNAVLQNVLANSWNAMLDTGVAKIAFRGGRNERGTEWLRISDTGRGLGVALAETPRLFEPFERNLKISADKRSVAIGGQGLGLAIVRMIASRRAATVRFVEPEPGFTTSFELSWRGGGK